LPKALFFDNSYQPFLSTLMWFEKLRSHVYFLAMLNLKSIPNCAYEAHKAEILIKPNLNFFEKYEIVSLKLCNQLPKYGKFE